MHVSRVITADGDIIVISPADVWDELKPDLDKFIRRAELLTIIQEITDLAELPEYLSDEDLRVIEAAKLKLDELRELKAMVSEQVIERDKTGG